MNTLVILIGILSLAVGPVEPLPEEVIASIQQMSLSELLEELKGSDLQRGECALKELTRDGLDLNELELLTQLAIKQGGGKHSTMIICHLAGRVGPICETTATEEEKAKFDKFVDLLEEELKKKEEPGRIPFYLGIMGFERIISPKLEGGRAYRRENRNRRPPVPYGNDRVTDILLTCANHKDWRVRREAVRALGRVGANDPNRVATIVAFLEAQESKEQAREDFAEPQHKQDVLDRIAGAIRSIEIDLKQRPLPHE